MRILGLIVMGVIPLYGAFDYTIPDVDLFSTSESMVVSRESFSAYLLNPAVSSQVQNNQLSLFYSQPYGVEGLINGSFLTHFRQGRFGFGLAWNIFGNDLYRENQIASNIACNFFDGRLAVGLNLRWNHLNVSNYGSVNAAGLDGGIQYELYPEILMGFAVRNINQPKLNGYAEQLPLITRWGISAKLTDRFDMYFALNKDRWYPLSIRIGLVMKISSLFSLQSGFCSNPTVPSLGFALTRHWISFRYGFQYHFDLGGTHIWGVTFEP